MKLIKCYVSSFGTFFDYSYDFTDGLNVINQKNGWGKTTFATFIKCMFYGINDSKRSIEDNERKKYMPWNSSSKFGGYVVFEREGKQFKIERYFGSRSSDDTVSLYDLQTGKVFNSQEDLGKRLFGVDEEGFLFSTYLSQRDFEIKSNASLTAKFHETCDIQDSALFEKALEKLDLESKKLIARGDKGEINDLKRRITKVKEEISISQNARTELIRYTDIIKDTDRKIEEINKKISTLSTKISNYKSAVEYKNILNKRTELYAVLKDINENISSLDKFFNGNIVLCEKLEEYRSIYDEYVSAVNTVKALKDDLEETTILATKDTNSKTSSVSVKNFTPFILILLGVLGFFAGGVVGAITLTISIVLSFILYFLLVSKYKTFSKNDSQVENLIDIKRKKIDGVKQIVLEYENIFNDYFSKFNVGGTTYQEKLEEIKNNFNAYQNFVKEKQKVEEELSKTSIINNFSKEEINVNIDDVSKEINELNLTLSSLERERSNAKVYANRLAETADKLLDLETELSLLTEKLETSKSRYEILVNTIKFLNMADENLKIKYREPLEKSLNKYLSLIDENYAATIDIDFNMSVIKNGKTLSVEYFSEGLKNSFNICKRFAIIDVIFSKEKPFIILDDPLVNFDADRIKSTLDLFKKMQNEYQILYFVCHDSRGL